MQPRFQTIEMRGAWKSKKSVCVYVCVREIFDVTVTATQTYSQIKF